MYSVLFLNFVFFKFIYIYKVFIQSHSCLSMFFFTFLVFVCYIFLLMTKGGVVESIWLRLWAQVKIKIYNKFILGESSIGYAKQFVQEYRIHNQSTINKDSDWTSSRAKECYLKLRSIWKNTSEEMCLKNCVWRNGSEEELLKTRHQKQGHQKQWSSEAYLIRSYFTRVDKGHCTKCTATNSATTISAIFVSTTRQR